MVLVRWTLALLLGAVLVGVQHGADAVTDSVVFARVDIAVPAPQSVAIGDLDGQHGKDIVVALPAPGDVGVLLNNGDGTFAAMQAYSGGPECDGVAVDITLGDVTQPGGALVPDGKLDAYIACPPYVVRLPGDGAGALTNPVPTNLGVASSLGSGTPDQLALMRRPDGSPAPLLVFVHSTGSGTQLCISYNVDPLESLVCDATPAAWPLAVGDLNGSVAGVPPDEVVASEGGAVMGIFGFAPTFPLQWGDSTRNVPGDPAGQPGLESAVMGDLDNDGDLDVLAGQSVNSVNNRVDSIHYFHWDPAGAGGLEQAAHTLPSIAGLDAVAIADVDGDGCNDIVGAGGYGRGMVHLGDGAGGFDSGQDLPQIGYLNPATATRVTMAVADLTGDGRPEIVVSDQLAGAVMVFRNGSTTTGSACSSAAPVAVNDVAVVAQNAGPTAISVLANDTDPDGGPKFVTGVTPAANGIVKIAGSGVTYQPGSGYCNNPGGAPDTFTYTLNGGSVGTVAVAVQCAVAPPPPPPPAPRTCAAPGTTAYTVGTPGDDVLVGTASRDVLSGRGGDDCLFGRSNNDRLSGGTGDDLLDGSSGDDRMDGNAGDDKFRGWNGNDDITPGAGQDKVNGQGGDDTIFARDGEKDTIDCGAGRDIATVDRLDVVKNCEYVKRA